MPAPRPLILVEDLRFSYPSSTPASRPATVGATPGNLLDGLTFSVPPKQALAVMGPTSSGKSTLALILAGLAPEMTGGRLQGTVIVDGQDVTKTDAAHLSTHLGLVFQEPERQLFNMTVADEIAFGLESLALPPDRIKERLAWALQQAGLEGLEERAPWQLSGGEQKRLAIATILALQPPVLVLDEPMAGLDPAGRREMAAVLAGLRAATGATIMVLEKDPEFVARWAERVLVLAGGQVVMDGSPRSVFQETERLASLGLAAPQMAELAARLRVRGQKANFLTAREAAPVLRSYMMAGNSPAEQVRQRMLHPPERVSPPERADPAENQHHAPAIELQSVTFFYTPSPEEASVSRAGPALQEVTLQVPTGQFVAIVGPNGSGKTTLARHLVGLLRAHKGKVVINGTPVGSRAVGDLAREVGYVFQNPDHQIFAATVRDEVAFGLRNQGLTGRGLAKRVDDALAAYGLADFAEVPPAVLGYGLRRLVTVASTWAMRPLIWVLDEPTTGLDARHIKTLIDSMTALNRAGHTIMLISHDLRLVAETAQRVVVLEKGKLVLDGSTRQIMAAADALARYDLRPPPITRLSAQLAPIGFPHPVLTVEEFLQNWQALAANAAAGQEQLS